MASSGSTDSGVSARLFGSLLTWLNDHETDVFFVGTCNDISKLPPEFARAERFDGVFFVDLPGPAQQQIIWQMYLGKFGLDAKQTVAGGRSMDRRRDPGLLPAGGTAGCAARPSGPERGAGGGHGGRIGRAATGLGQRPVL